MRRLVNAWALLLLLIVSPRGGSIARAASLEHPTKHQLDEVAHLIGKHYFRKIAHDSLEAAALECLAGTLDRYSNYIPPREAREVQASLEGSVGGIGVSLALDTTAAVVRVVHVFKGSTAARAGLRPGDTLIAVEDRPVRGRAFDQVLDQIRGKPGTHVRLTIHHADDPTAVTLTLERFAVELPTVHGLRAAASEEGQWLIDPRSRVAFVRIENFSRRTPQEFDRALEAIRRVGARALVLDLRDDPGGLLESAVEVADRLLDSGAIVIIHERGKRDEVERADRAVSSRLPMAVLVNGFTASAAEVLGACLQDRRRAIVVGSRSYGKGAVQNLFHLRRTPGLLKLTIALYQRPSGQPMETHIPGVGSPNGGVWPDSGYSVALSPQRERDWRESSMRAAGGFGFTAEEPDTSALFDPVLERAVQGLRPTP